MHLKQQVRMLFEITPKLIKTSRQTKSMKKVISEKQMVTKELSQVIALASILFFKCRHTYITIKEINLKRINWNPAIPEETSV